MYPLDFQLIHLFLFYQQHRQLNNINFFLQMSLIMRFYYDENKMLFKICKNIGLIIGYLISDHLRNNLYIYLYLNFLNFSFLYTYV